MQTFRDIGEEQKFIRHQQISKYGHIYSIVVNLIGSLNNVDLVQNSEVILQIMEDADFHITHLIGSVQDTDSAGNPFSDDPDNSDNYGFGTTYPKPIAVNENSRGLWFKFVDPKTNRDLQKIIPTGIAADSASQYLTPYDFTMLEFNSVFGPGYGSKWGKPVKFQYVLNRGERLKIKFQNRVKISSEIGLTYQRVAIGFIGNRYER